MTKCLGWIKLHRKMLDNPIITKDGDYLSVWIYLLLNATHDSIDAVFDKDRVTLEPGQLITGRKSISKALGVNESKVFRILKKLKNEQQIEQRSCNVNSLITITNWAKYQASEQQIEQQVNNNRTASEHKQECNNVNKEIIDYLNSKASKKYRHSTGKTISLINARMKEGFTVEDFKKVIDNRVIAWLHDEKMNDYLRPDTLFGTKFEGYLNAKQSPLQIVEEDPYWAERRKTPEVFY